MLHILLLSFLYVTNIFSYEIHNVKLQKGFYQEFVNPGYPEFAGWINDTIEWNFEADPGEKIKLSCSDIRMMSQSFFQTNDCPLVYISVLDDYGERKICGSSVMNFVHKSNANKLKVKIGATIDGAFLFHCIAKNIADPVSVETIRLNPNGRAVWRFVNGDMEPQPHLDLQWVFESPPGIRMSFQCNVALPNKEPMCGIASLTFNNGIYEEEICDSNNYVWFSKTNSAKLRIQFDQTGLGVMECLVQAVTGPHPNEYENVVSQEVDSTEHGVTPGRKKTSCKCGWTNKNLGRVMNGQETKVNEFPWMVHLYISRFTNGNYMEVTCGGSIITPRHVLTAAHCVVFDNVVVDASGVRMILAQHNVNKPNGHEIAINAENIIVGNTYLEKGLEFDDIAMIFTKEKIDFSTPYVGPICIEPQEYDVVNRRIITMGWGLNEYYEPSTILRKAKTRVMDRAICQGNDWDVCTTTAPSSSCQGDSGGPLVWLDPDTNRYSQISLVSRGITTPLCKGRWTYSTLVAHYYESIQGFINATDPSVRTCHKL
uniref:Venom s1 protease 44 n=1 Tax=Pristhesancus plagipennis TaxID=1955184 RepID=A0A1Q1NPJ3_PRIPG|nr:venom s1 protease 44 [Pristhesancus plagipennis]